MRLLSFARTLFPKMSTKDLRYSIEQGFCRVNGQVERFCSRRVSQKDHVELKVAKRPQRSFDRRRILFEDEHLVAYNKPSGVTMDSFSSHLLVHRLDKGTSGVLLLAKTPAMQKELEKLFAKREIHKEYVALVEGVPRAEGGEIVKPLDIVKRGQGFVRMGIKEGGQFARTDWRRIKRGKTQALLHLRPLTGRTHQIRVHLASIGHSVVGDLDYGTRSQKISRLQLHAKFLSFIHPFSQEKVSLRAEDFIVQIH